MPVATTGSLLDIAPGESLAVSSGDDLAVQNAHFMPAPWQAQCKLVDFGADLTPPLGYAAQRIGRLGARWSVTFSSVPAMGAACARSLIAMRLAARSGGLTTTFAWPQAAFAAAIGAPEVNGAGQRGTQLTVDGLTPSLTTLLAGSFFSMIVGSRSYLHCLTDTAQVDAGGNAVLQIAPMLRAQPADETALNFLSPQIEGFIAGQSEDWQLDRLAWASMPSFTVMEAQ